MSKSPQISIDSFVLSSDSAVSDQKWPIGHPSLLYPSVSRCTSAPSVKIMSICGLSVKIVTMRTSWIHKVGNVNLICHLCHYCMTLINVNTEFVVDMYSCVSFLPWKEFQKYLYFRVLDYPAHLL